MEYHMQYPLNEEIKQEKETFVEKPIEKENLRKMKSVYIIILLYVLTMFTVILVYCERAGNKNELTENTFTEDMNDEYILSALLKSKNGKKFILSKLEELISLNYKNNKSSIKNDREENKNEIIDTDGSTNKKKEGNLTVENIGRSVNLHDVKFLMNNLQMSSEFYLFLKNYEKKYESSNEMNNRFLIFSQNYKKVEEHNKTDTLFKMGLNKFTDMSFDDLSNMYLNISVNDVKEKSDNSVHHDIYNKIIKIYKKEEDLNETQFDWREHNGVSQIRDQKMCASSWALSAIGTIESQYAIRKNINIFLSEKELVECNDQCHGCFNGNIPQSFDYILKNGGLCSDEEYLYTDDVVDGCHGSSCKTKYPIKTYASIPLDKFKEAIKYMGPISVLIAVSREFIAYKSGIYNGSCANKLNHHAMLVGFGVEETYNEEKKQTKKNYYYIIKNSWGTEWGENGFMRFITNESGTHRHCLLSGAYFPIIE